ncbi:Protein kinase superfamily protein [Zea mays]|nr:Protein kinase superfamily protein [Zea mays]
MASGSSTPATTSASSPATTVAVTTYTDPSALLKAAGRRDGSAAPPWKAVAEAWRSRAKRQLSVRIPSLGPTMSSTLRRLSSRRTDNIEVHEFCVLKPTLRTFSLAELKKATRNFSKENVVGRGGFAKVYRGSLPGGELVAVKKLTATQGAERMEGFLSELGHVVNVSHPNIARLVGVGVDGGEHLVFPFSRLGCLSGMLHSNSGAEPMPWEARYRVALGTARGLEYLHERCARRIVHRDIKPANILLMDNYEPLICDFGLARWLPAKLTHLQVSVFEGTFGYVPPEYTTHGVFSEKTDVFALGVVLLELLTGRRAVDTAKLSLVAWAKQYLEVDDDDEDETLKMADPALGGRYDAEQLRNMAWAAKLCVHASPHQRPQMSEVVQILAGEGAHLRGGRGAHGVDDELLPETDGYDGDAAPGYVDDLSRHKALAFAVDVDVDSDEDSTPPVRHAPATTFVREV